MASARPAPLDRDPPAPGKRGFANRVRGFVNRVRPSRPVPGFPYLWIAGVAAAALMIVTGGFRTGAMPLPQRMGFWLLLMGGCTLKWQVWFYFTVRKPEDWIWSSAASALILSLPIPLEIRLAARAVGLNAEAPSVFDTWGRSLAIGVCIFLASLLVIWAAGRRAKPAADPPVAGLLSKAVSYTPLTLPTILRV